jgi:hypothetical protein
VNMSWRERRDGKARGAKGSREGHHQGSDEGLPHGEAVARAW